MRSPLGMANWALRVELVGRSAVEPVDRAAVGDSLRGNRANVSGSKTLTKDTSVELLDVLFLQSLQFLVSGLVYFLGMWRASFTFASSVTQVI